MSTQGRPTVYRGIEMRSRLEADVAQRWMDAEDRRECGITWEYEPKCFAGVSGQYLPDFVIHYGGAFGIGDEYWEVKPHTFPSDRLIKVMDQMETIWESERDARLSLVLWEYGDGPRIWYWAQPSVTDCLWRVVDWHGVTVGVLDDGGVPF